MASINARAVIVSGLLPGIVMNPCDMFRNSVLLKDDMLAVADRLRMDPATATSFSAGMATVNPTPRLRS